MSDGRPALDHALGDGEDFELAFAVAPADGERLLRTQPVPGITLHHIGECLGEPGLWLEEGGARQDRAQHGHRSRLRQSKLGGSGFGSGLVARRPGVPQDRRARRGGFVLAPRPEHPPWHRAGISQNSSRPAAA